MRLSSLALLAFGPVLALASNVVDLDSKNFGSFVGGAKGALVEFYAPWCGHCKTLAPVYEQLADSFAGKDVVIAKTDADGKGKDLGRKYGVKGYPTIKYFPPNSLEPVDYASARDLDSLAAFVTKQTGLKSKVKAPAPSLATVLDASNHDSIALDADKDVLVAYTAPWCGHCKSLKPIFEKLAADFANEASVVVAQFDADDARNKAIANRYGVKSYPTLKFFPRGKKAVDFVPTAYEAARTEQAFVDFINEHAGTARTVGGGLSALAGLIPSLDAFTPDFLVAPAESAGDLLARAQAAVEAVGGQASSVSGQYYLKVAKKIAEKGTEAKAWLLKEQARLAKLTASPALAPTKKDELVVKTNILGSFLAAKVERAAEDVVEAYDAAVEKTGEAYDAAVEKGGEVYEAVKSTGEQVVQRVREEL